MHSDETKSLNVKAHSHETTARYVSKLFEAIGGTHLRLWITVDQNKYNLVGVISTNLSMVSKDLRAARRVEGVVLQPKSGHMLNVLDQCHGIL